MGRARENHGDIRDLLLDLPYHRTLHHALYTEDRRFAPSEFHQSRIAYGGQLPPVSFPDPNNQSLTAAQHLLVKSLL